MKFSLIAVLSATCVSSAVGEVFLKEQFNDDVSVERVMTLEELPLFYWSLRMS